MAIFATYNIETKSDDFLRFVSGISEYTHYAIEYETKINVLDNVFLREFEVYAKNRLKDGGYITRLKFEKGFGYNRVQIYTNFPLEDMQSIISNASMTYIIEGLEIHLDYNHNDMDRIIANNLEEKYNKDSDEE